MELNKRKSIGGKSDGLKTRSRMRAIESNSIDASIYFTTAATSPFVGFDFTFQK
jgi:hypothetical protein